MWLVVLKNSDDILAVTNQFPDTPDGARDAQTRVYRWNDYNKRFMEDNGEHEHNVYRIRQFVIHSSELPLFVH